MTYQKSDAKVLIIILIIILIFSSGCLGIGLRNIEKSKHGLSNTVDILIPLFGGVVLILFGIICKEIKIIHKSEKIIKIMSNISIIGGIIDIGFVCGLLFMKYGKNIMLYILNKINQIIYKIDNLLHGLNLLSLLILLALILILILLYIRIQKCKKYKEEHHLCTHYESDVRGCELGQSYYNFIGPCETSNKGVKKNGKICRQYREEDKPIELKFLSLLKRGLYLLFRINN